MGTVGVPTGGRKTPKFPPKEGVITTLQRGYTLVDPEAIWGFIKGSDFLLTTLEDIPPVLADYFPDQPLSLGYIALDGNPCLLLSIHTPWGATRAGEALRQFSYQWWLPRWDSRLIITLCFRPLHEYLRYDAKGQSILHQIREEEKGDPTL